MPLNKKEVFEKLTVALKAYEDEEAVALLADPDLTKEDYFWLVMQPVNINVMSFTNLLHFSLVMRFPKIFNYILKKYTAEDKVPLFTQPIINGKNSGRNFTHSLSATGEIGVLKRVFEQVIPKSDVLILIRQPVLITLDPEAEFLGFTPLHFAAYRFKMDVLAYLLHCLYGSNTSAYINEFEKILVIPQESTDKKCLYQGYTLFNLALYGANSQGIEVREIYSELIKILDPVALRQVLNTHLNTSLGHPSCLNYVQQLSAMAVKMNKAAKKKNQHKVQDVAAQNELSESLLTESIQINKAEEVVEMCHSVVVDEENENDLLNIKSELSCQSQKSQLQILVENSKNNSSYLYWLQHYLEEKQYPELDYEQLGLLLHTCAPVFSTSYNSSFFYYSFQGPDLQYLPKVWLENYSVEQVNELQGKVDNFIQSLESKKAAEIIMTLQSQPK